MKKIIDIVDIKNAKYLKFYVENGFIYCENSSGERVIVGDNNVKDCDFIDIDLLYGLIKADLIKKVSEK